MAPKPKSRKRSAKEAPGDNKRNTKKTKNAEPSADPASNETHPVPRDPSNEAEKQEVSWVLPRGSKRNASFDEEAAQAFAPVLFQRPWNALSTRQTERLESSPIPSPVHSKRVSQRTIDRALESNRSSDVLKNFFKQIQAETSDEWSLGNYNFHSFATAFGQCVGDDCAVVAARDIPPFVLDQDYKAEV